MLMIIPICDRIKLLPYSLKYYTSLGVTQFICAVYNGRQNPFFEEIVSYNSKYNLQVRTSFECEFHQYSPQREMHGLNKIREEFSKQYDWYGIADLDEFHFCGGKNCLEIVEEAEANKFNAVHGIFFDRVAADGSFPEINDKKLDDTFPNACNLTSCSRAACNKIAFAKSHVRIECGHHRANTKVWRNVIEVHHFKWQKGVFEIIADSQKRFKQLGLPMANRELRLMLKLINKNGINTNNPKLKISKANLIGV
jgi:hypothetical protein